MSLRWASRPGHSVPPEIEAVGTKIVDACYNVHRALGPGLLEKAYEAILAHELRRRGCHVKQQVLVPLLYDGIEVDGAYRMDLLVDDTIVVEVKAVSALTKEHEAQLLTYLRFSGKPLGFAVNFGLSVIRGQIWRRLRPHRPQEVPKST